MTGPNEDDGCDLIIVMGTALAVAPFNNIIFQSECPKVLINLENTQNNGFDFDNKNLHPERCFLKGKCDEVIYKILSEVGWIENLKTLMPNLKVDNLNKSSSLLNYTSNKVK